MAVRRSRRLLLNLPSQVVILLVTLVILSSLAVGIPAIGLIRGQLGRHAWELATQASQTTEALLSARQSDLDNLATVTAQRPTLSSLVEQGDRDKIAPYLETFRAAAGLDLIMLCDVERRTIVQVGKPVPEQACLAATNNNIIQSPDGFGAPGLLLAAQSLPGNSLISVIVGQAIDAGFLNQLQLKTGLEHLFLYDGEYMAGSIPYDNLTWKNIGSPVPLSSNSPKDSAIYGVFTQDDIPYYAIRSRFGESNLEAVVALPVADIVGSQQRLTWLVAGGILIVSILCSALGIFLVQRISAPLERLRDSANALRKGDLATPVLAKTNVAEIAQVAYALEDARIALKHSMTELRQQKAWVDHILESVVEGIVTLDRHGSITFFSKGAEQITNLKQEQVLGKVIDDVFRVKDGNERFSENISSPDRRQDIVTVLAGDRPVTLAITHAKLTPKLAPPEAGNADLALVLRDVSNENAIRRLLGDFLANVTHEFRTPLTAQAVSIELLLDQLDDLSSAEIRELLNAHYLGVLSLQTLIDNLLEGASIEAGRFKMYPQPTELAEVIVEVVQIMRPLFEKYDLALRVNLPEILPLVKADPRRTNQVLVNLLSNAIKWGQTGPDILLDVIVCGDEVKVLVADRGPGIPPQHRRDLFVRLSGIQSPNSRAESGAGLGLSVVKTIVEAQGGQVGVEDRPDGGAIFWFTIPALDSRRMDEDFAE